MTSKTRTIRLILGTYKKINCGYYETYFLLRACLFYRGLTIFAFKISRPKIDYLTLCLYSGQAQNKSAQIWKCHFLDELALGAWLNALSILLLLCMWYLFYYCYNFFFFFAILHLAVVACSEPKRQYFCATPCQFLVNVLYTLQLTTTISKATVLRRKFMPCTMGAPATLSANFSAANTFKFWRWFKKKKKKKRNVQRADSV